MKYDKHENNASYVRLNVQCCTSDDGRKDRPKHVECHSKIKKNIDTLVHLVVFSIEMCNYSRQLRCIIAIGLHIRK